MQNDSKGIKDLIDRYVYQVVKHLPPAQRADIEQELRGLIEDMLSARGENPTLADAEAVLKELGMPAELAAKYRGSKRHLIGPEYYDTYIFILKIVLAAVAFGMGLAQIIGNIVSPPENVWAAIGLFFASIFNALVQAFAWVTGIFALMEHFVREKIWKKDEWKPSDLPPVPVQQAVIKKSEPIVGIIFSILWLILITTAPQLIGVYIAPAGEVTDIAAAFHSAIPVFNLTVLMHLMPLVVVITGLGILKEALRLAEGRYTVRLAIIITLINVTSLILFIWVYGRPDIWNPHFMASLNEAWGTNAAVTFGWSIIPKILVGLAIFGNIVDSITAFTRALRNKETKIL